MQLSIPPEFKGNVVAFLTEIEQLQVEPDLAAKIVIDERSGIIVMGRDVRVATVAVAQGNLTVTISESPQVSQPNPLSRGRTVVTPDSRVGVTEDGKKFALVKDGVSLQQLVDGLNGLGHRAARPDRHPAGDQGRGRHPGRYRGDVMQTGLNSFASRPVANARSSIRPPDLELAQALTKVSPQAQAKAKTTATDFEAMFLNQMFSQMTNGLKGEGPFGDTPGTGVWRSMLTEQYSKSFAKAGGIGISKDVYRELILQQARQAAGQRTRGKPT